MKYSGIYIIYNPSSTGSSKDVAVQIRRKLKQNFPNVSIYLKATKYAGHAEKIAYTAAKESQKTLIISSSGDGGYNEVVNGAIRAQLEGLNPVLAVLPAGNANDHSRTLQSDNLIKHIVGGKEKSIDLLKISYCKGSKAIVRYAHSYAGLGLTPVVAVELNKTDLNALKESWIVLKTFYKFRPFKIKVHNRVFKLDSILFANIGQMAKVLTIAKNAKPNDGKFEVIIFPHANKLNLAKKLAKAAATGLEPNKRSKQYEFEALKKMPIQIDGEVLSIDKNSKVTIESAHKILKTIL